ncbi:MAG: hypothetical protein IJP31_02395 [Lachnospiraceae bacterium]|nr:hypothetical protein [Lachnospiraceae bacterium]
MKKQYTYALITVCIWSTMATVVKAMLFDIPSLQALSIGRFFTGKNPSPGGYSPVVYHRGHTFAKPAGRKKIRTKF